MAKQTRPLLNARLIRAEGTRLLDSRGEELRLRGINLIHKGNRLKDGSVNFYPNWPENLQQRLAGLGMNALRLGVLWAAIEPRPGQYDARYLDFIRHQLDLAEKAGLYVLLDMHQDLYAQRFSDGAPDWAVLTDAPFEETALWSDAYLTSPAVQGSWDAFWDNRQVPQTGLGVQDHFTATWGMLAGRFGGHPALLGYDILNEPAPGSDIQQMFGQVLMAFHSLLTPQEQSAFGLMEAGPEQLAGLFLDQQARHRMLQLLDDPARYRQLGELSQEPVIHFERHTLEPFYEKTAAAIRARDGDTFLLRGNNYLSNIGIPSGIRPIRVNGKPDPRQIFAPHGYDLVVDTPAMAAPSDSRAASIFTRHRETQLQLNLPAVVTEWGAFGGYASALTHGRFLLDMFEGWGWGHTYWCYTDDFFEVPATGLFGDRAR
ncbi:MAG: cellulase family glycosylhydrolase [Clostridiales bacterium]|nr:cellulase family glycosylhydrolase [Clostridiales bacterium]